MAPGSVDPPPSASGWRRTGPSNPEACKGQPDASNGL